VRYVVSIFFNQTSIPATQNLIFVLLEYFLLTFSITLCNQLSVLYKPSFLIFLFVLGVIVDENKSDYVKFFELIVKIL
jgi:hypothetical protein